MCWVIQPVSEPASGAVVGIEHIGIGIGGEVEPWREPELAKSPVGIDLDHRGGCNHHVAADVVPELDRQIAERREPSLIMADDEHLRSMP